MHDTHLYLNTATLATLDKLGPSESCVVRVTTQVLSDFRATYVVALDAGRFTEAERLASAAAVFDGVLAATVDGVAITSLASDVARFKLALAGQLRAELGVDPLRAGPTLRERTPPDATDDPLDSLQSQYGRNIVCPPADQPLAMANGTLTFTGEPLANIRGLWDGKQRNAKNAMLIFHAAAAGTRTFFCALSRLPQADLAQIARSSMGVFAQQKASSRRAALRRARRSGARGMVWR